MYEIKTFYSEEDEGYIAIVPALPGCSAFGKSEEEALEEIKIAQSLWLEAAESEGREIPNPNVSQENHSPSSAITRIFN